MVDHQEVDHYTGLSGIISHGYGKRNDSHRGDKVPCEPVDWVRRGFEVTDLQACLLKSLVVQDVHQAPIVYQDPVHFVVGHHCSNNQGITVRVIRCASLSLKVMSSFSPLQCFAGYFSKLLTLMSGLSLVSWT